jgi:hypothetical protein
MWHTSLENGDLDGTMIFFMGGIIEDVGCFLGRMNYLGGRVLGILEEGVCYTTNFHIN